MKEEIVSITENPGTARQIQELEDIVYQWQCSIYQKQIAILNEEELLAKIQLEAIQKVLQGTII